MRHAAWIAFVCSACTPTATQIVEVPVALLPPSAGGPPPPRRTLQPESPVDTPAYHNGHMAPPSTPVSPTADFGQCMRSRMCELEGMCSPHESGLCIAQSNDDCRPSDACLGGRCTARDGVCIAGSDEDCRTSWACKGWGRCSHDGNDSCIATAQADCEASTRCQRDGECTRVGDECIKR